MGFISSKEYQDLEDNIIKESVYSFPVDKFCYSCPKFNKEYNTCIAEYCYTWW
jgi:hypothetical protein